ncbi:AAA family ATPase [Beijerinckia mobilis]|uniref:AAA family ATPase n=1 Tax=Beijerinckia mobilis TaxID=231434 RepID=UPI0005515E99|nr:AAA family ATPase [Beijerinckia mobilis]
MYRITDIVPRGKAPIPLNIFTVIVGPNNAGKSQLLRDITLCASGRKEQMKVLEHVGIDIGRSAIELVTSLAAGLKANNAGQYFLDGAGISLDENMSIQYFPNQLAQHTLSEDTARAFIASSFVRQLLAYLTTEARLSFSKHKTNLHRPHNPGVTSLVEALFQSSNSNEDEKWLSERIQQAFNIEVALDNFSDPGALEMRVADSFVNLPRDDRARAREFMQKCARLDEQGDGLRSFVATLGAAKSLSREVILVDEPEAFLHPPQAFQMGKALCGENFGGKQIICSTHSADFLRGVIAARTDITVIRISRGRNGQLVTSLSPEELKTIAGNHVLSSGRVLDGIFYRKVVITESDGDAVLYGALSTNDDRAGETYYVNSYSKQATATVATPYKHMCVPHAAIVDIDLIRIAPEFLKVVQAFLKDTEEAVQLAASVRSCIEATPSSDLVAKVIGHLEELPVKMAELNLASAEKKLEWLKGRLSDLRAETSAWSKLKRFGVQSDLLNEKAKDDLKRLIHICADVGLFLVPVGERESWLEPDVPYSKNKTAYTTRALEYLASRKLGDDAPLSKFMNDLHAYLDTQ